MTPSYRCIGGTIVWGSKPLTDGQVQALADLFLSEHDAALRAGDRIAARAARSLFLDVTSALKAQADWARCTRVAA